MKKIGFVLMVVLISFSLIGCTGQNASTPDRSHPVPGQSSVEKYSAAKSAEAKKTASAQLAETEKTLESLNDVLGNLDEVNSEDLVTPFTNMYKALSASRLAVNTEMLFYSRNQELLNPRGVENSFLNDQAVRRISSKLPLMQDNTVNTIRIGKDKYFVLSYSLTDSTGRGPAIIFVSHADKEIALVRFINLVLISIMLIGALLASWIANQLSARIASPVRELCRLTEKIGQGEFGTPVETSAKNDILELHTLTQSIGEMAAKLDANDKTQKAFLQNASHELKTPLMSIQGYAEGVINGVLPDAKQAAQIIHSESRRLGTLVEELLTLSRIESQTYTKELVSMNLGNILKDYIQRLGGLAAKQQRELSLSLPDNPICIKADDTLLSQAVINIVSNCLRYAKTNVKITLLEAGDSAVIRITDDGIGIQHADLPHIFERFYKGKGGNSGLGLAIAKSAVEFMGGIVRADNGEVGAIFEIILPRDKGIGTMSHMSST